MSQLYWQLWFKPEWGLSELQETPERQLVLSAFLGLELGRLRRGSSATCWPFKLWIPSRLFLSTMTVSNLCYYFLHTTIRDDDLPIIMR